MSSLRGEIASNTKAKTIGRRPTKQPQIFNIPTQFSEQPLNENNAWNSIFFGVEEEKNDVNSNGNPPASYFDSFTAGYRFRPLDEELLVHHLRKKVMKDALPPNRINEINVCQYRPDQLAGEITSNTIATTIGRRPTKQPQVFDIPTQFSEQPLTENKAWYSILFGGEEEERNDVNSNGNPPASYIDSFPAGYRFRPLDEELVVHYLRKKVMKKALPPNRINEINIYQYSPDQLAEKYKRPGEKEMYFFTPRDKKYPNGSRPNRAAAQGYWKASGVEKSVKFKEEIVGFKKTLVFYNGKFCEGEKTNWIMHEFRVNDPPPRTKTSSNDMRDSKKIYRSLKSSKAHEATDKPVMNSECEYNVVADSRRHAINQVISQNEIHETPHFSNNPLQSMDNIDELSNPNLGISLDMLEPWPIFTPGPSNHPTNELSWSSILMDLQDDIWSSFMP